MIPIQELTETLRAKFAETRLETETFDSGAVWLDIYIKNHWFVFATEPTYSRIGVSRNDDTKASFSAHDAYFNNFEEAESHLMVLIADAINPE